MLNPKKLLQQFALFWVSFMLLHLLSTNPTIRNGLAKMNAPLFNKTAQWYLPEVKLQSRVKPTTGEVAFNFYSHLEVAQKRKTAKAGKVSVTTYEYVNNPRFHFNTALIFLLSLFIATPVAWGKRLILAGAGTVLFYLFSLIRISVHVKNEISQLGIGLYESSPSSFFNLHKISNFLGALGFIFIVAVFIWAFLVFSKTNLKQIRTYLT